MGATLAQRYPMPKLSARVFEILVLSISIVSTAFLIDAHADNTFDSAVSHVGVGAGVSFTRPSDNDGQSSQGVAFVYRWHSFHSHWGPTFALDFHGNDFNQPIGPVTVPLGTVRMRAILAGFGRTQHVGRLYASASVIGGYSFNHLTEDSNLGAAFGTAGRQVLGASVNDCAVLKPEVSGWFDVTRHIGVGLSAAYFIARPDKVFSTPGGSDVQHLRADAFELTAGLTFGIWKKR
jgi:hypothetical protein